MSDTQSLHTAIEVSGAAASVSAADRPRKPPITAKVKAGLRMLVEEADAAIEFLDTAIEKPISPSKTRLAEFKERRDGLTRARDWLARRIAAAT